MKTSTLAGLIGVVALVGAVAFAILIATEVTDRGKDLRPYESGPVYQIEIADSVTAYADAESKPDPDTISGSVLVALATAALFALLILRRAGAERRLRLFYGLATAGFAFLAFDEFQAVHETLGHNMAFLGDLPGVERPDDVVYALWLLPAVAFVLWFRDIFLATPRLRLLFGVALLGGFLTGITDLTGSMLDDPLEIITAAFLIAGFATLIATHVFPRIEPATDSIDSADPAYAGGASREP